VFVSLSNVPALPNWEKGCGEKHESGKMTLSREEGLSQSPISAEKRNLLDRLLLLFADVRAGEGLTAILMAINLFLLLTAYLIIKTVREALILSEGGAEIKSYAAAGQALLLLLVVPAYGFVASKVNRISLINWVTVFFVSNLIAFYLLAQIRLPLGVPFFLWVGIFNLFIIAQFWSFANDIYTEDQGKRLFAIVAFGGSLGAILGPKLASWLFEPFGAYRLMLVTAGLLVLAVVLPNIVNRREKSRSLADKKAAGADKPLGKDGAFKLVIGKRYLLLIALLMVVLNLVNTTGEFILGKTVVQEAQRIAILDLAPYAGAAGGDQSQEQTGKKVQDFIAGFYGNFFFTVNLLSALAQLFLVSRIMKFAGVPASLFFLPILALGSYSFVAFMPVLAYIKVAKILENSTDYSLQNTARQALFLPTSREEKYKAKAAIDTFFVRMGDVLSTALVFVSVQLALGVRVLSVVNVLLVALWFLLVFGIGRSYRALTEGQPKAGVKFMLK
jgi:ATP:ADP antiporter, AAA family